MTRTIYLCHDKDEWKENGCTFHRSWCGRVTYDDNTPLTDKEEQRILKQTKRELERPRAHCPKCIKGKKAAIPGYVPPSIHEASK